MKALVPYLMFDGSCREALTFYAHVLNGRLSLEPYSYGPDAPLDTTRHDVKETSLRGDRIQHGSVVMGPWVLMASDTAPGMPSSAADNFSLAIACEDTAEQDRFFTQLSAGGEITLPLAEQLWGARFGMLKDRFGISWMLNCDLPTA